MNKILQIFLLLLSSHTFCQEVAILKYDGGGDWYANPTAVPNLIKFCNDEINAGIKEKPQVVTTESNDIFNYPIVFITGHGNVLFTPAAVENLKKYLNSGGFIHISDNYGLDKFIRREMKKVFPEHDFVEIPKNHPIFNQTFTFDDGLPKIHEHDAKPPTAYGIFIEGRLVCFYDFESDLSDGWEDLEVHNDNKQTRTKALRMGANIIEYAFKN